MLEEEKEKLKEKFSLFFEDKLQFLEKKFREDLSHIEEMKYEFVDNCLKVLNDQPKESEEKIILEDIEKKHEKEHKEEKKHEKEHKEEKKMKKKIRKKRKLKKNIKMKKKMKKKIRKKNKTKKNIKMKKKQ